MTVVYTVAHTDNLLSVRIISNLSQNKFVRSFGVRDFKARINTFAKNSTTKVCGYSGYDIGTEPACCEYGQYLDEFDCKNCS